MSLRKWLVPLKPGESCSTSAVNSKSDHQEIGLSSLIECPVTNYSSKNIMNIITHYQVHHTNMNDFNIIVDVIGKPFRMS